MGLAYKAAPVQIISPLDQCFFATFPFPTPHADPGSGGGGSESITVQQGGLFKLAWHGSPPAGYTQPSHLTGKEHWWINGLHTYARLTWSQNWGLVVSRANGLLPGGSVGACHARYWPFNEQDFRRWEYLGADTSGERGPNAFYAHLGYDYGLRSDLVIMGDGTEAFLDVRKASGFPAVVGEKVWTGTKENVSANYQLGVINGQWSRINLPWRKEWWIAQLPQGDGNGIIWGFNHSTKQSFEVDIPPAARAFMAGSFGDNLSMEVDFMGRRVIVAQVDSLAVPVANRYPLVLWEIDPETRQWTRLVISPVLVSKPEKPMVNPLTSMGGFKFRYWSNRAGGASSTIGTIRGTYSNGGFDFKEIYVAKARMPRTATFKQHRLNWPGHESFLRQKHAEMAYRDVDGKVYLHGGDTETHGGYSSPLIYSFFPEEPNSVALVGPFCEGNRVMQPLRTDENGFQYRAISDDFWMKPGYSYSDSYGPAGLCGYASRADWEKATGGPAQIWRWDVKKPAGSRWTANAWKGAPGFEKFPMAVGEPANKRWYYDKGSDHMIVPAYGYSPDILWQTGTIYRLNCADSTYTRARYDRLTKGETVFPDGRPASFGLGDRAGMDPIDGWLYFFHATRGDVLRINTRTTYQFQGFPYHPVEWCCKVSTHTGSSNLHHLVFAKGCIWIFVQSNAERVRLFSWKPGDGLPVEHYVPLWASATSVCKYKVGKDERIVLIGAGPYTHLSRNPIRAACDRHWATVELDIN